VKLALPSLTVIDRAVPYAFTHVEIPIYAEDAPRAQDAARLDLLQMQAYVASTQEAEARGAGPAAARRLDRIIQVDVGSRFVTAPGDPSPFVWRDVGAVDCETLSGTAAVYCAVMARR
jgi:hypothetical protein